MVQSGPGGYYATPRPSRAVGGSASSGVGAARRGSVTERGGSTDRLLRQFSDAVAGDEEEGGRNGSARAVLPRPTSKTRGRGLREAAADPAGRGVRLWISD